MIRRLLAVVGVLCGFAATALAQTQPCPQVIQAKIVSASTYTLQTSDLCQVVVLTATTGISVKLPAPGLIFPPQWRATVMALNGGSLTFTGLPDDAGRTHLVNNASSLTLLPGAGAALQILQDMNWWVLPTGSTGTGAMLPPVVENNAALRNLTSLFSTAVIRLAPTTGVTAPPVVYVPSAAACTLNGGAGDGGSQVRSSDGKCWLAKLGPNPTQVSVWEGADPTSATDSTTALQYALDWSAANALPVTLGAASASYQIRQLLTCATNTQLLGEGSTITGSTTYFNATTQGYASNGNFMLCAGETGGAPYTEATNIRVAGVKFQLTGSADAVLVNGLTIRNASDVYVDVEVTGFGNGAGVRLESIDNTNGNSFIKFNAHDWSYNGNAAGAQSDGLSVDNTLINNKQSFGLVIRGKCSNLLFGSTALAALRHQTDCINLNGALTGRGRGHNVEVECRFVNECVDAQTFGGTFDIYCFGCTGVPAKFIYGASYNLINVRADQFGQAAVLYAGNTGSPVVNNYANFNARAWTIDATVTNASTAITFASDARAAGIASGTPLINTSGTIPGGTYLATLSADGLTGTLSAAATGSGTVATGPAGRACAMMNDFSAPFSPANNVMDGTCTPGMHDYAAQIATNGLNNTINILATASGQNGGLATSGYANVSSPSINNNNTIRSKTPSRFSAYLSAAQSIPNGVVDTQVLYDTVQWDTQSEWNSTTKKFVAKFPGFYRACTGGRFAALGTDKEVVFKITTNGTGTRAIDSVFSAMASAVVCSDIYLTEGDTIEGTVAQGDTGAINLSANSALTFLSVAAQ